MNATQRQEPGPKAGAIPPCETAVEWLDLDFNTPAAAISISRFTGAGGVEEWHVTVCLDGSCPDPCQSLETAWLAALDSAGILPSSTVMRRVFCSDVVNQSSQLAAFARSYPGAFSAIGQTPLSGGKFALWSHHIHDPDVPPAGCGSGAFFSLTRGTLRHCWFSGLCDTTVGEAHAQADAVLQKQVQALAELGMSLSVNMLRTWWFVRNIDADYQALVEARRTHFNRHDLTDKTHYIASTGIAGTHPDPSAALSLDSYAIGGISSAQVQYLSAMDHLGPTHSYGVTFERATAISYADRCHVLISGTASIDTAGEIVHPGKVLKQLDRTLENISALLAAAKAGLDDLAMILVYLRDPADREKVEKALKSRLGKLPMILLHAPVCRPGWLIEIEGVAIASTRIPELPEF
jgi:enamine deaminase RidA (YjgF/YER057c/UK114 family)